MDMSLAFCMLTSLCRFECCCFFPVAHQPPLLDTVKRCDTRPVVSAGDALALPEWKNSCQNSSVHPKFWPDVLHSKTHMPPLPLDIGDFGFLADLDSASKVGTWIADPPTPFILMSAEVDVTCRHSFTGKVNVSLFLNLSFWPQSYIAWKIVISFSSNSYCDN